MNALPDISLGGTPPGLPFLEYKGVCGTGSTSVIWRALDTRLGHDVAVKMLREDCGADEQIVAQFVAKGRALSELDHPCLVCGHGVETVDGRPCLLMDYLDGRTVQDMLLRRGHLKEADCRVILASVASALNYAWGRGHLVHGDVNPSKLTIGRDGAVRLMADGLVASMVGMSEDPLSDVVGNPAYMSPEQIYGDRDLDCRTDIYSLGATLYHLLTGHVLFPGLQPEYMLLAHVDCASQAPDPRLFVPTLPTAFVNLLGRMLVKDRNLRLPDWSTVNAAIAELQAGGDIPPPPPEAASSIRIDGAHL